MTLRANVSTAAASMLVSNAATYGPLCYAAWRLGKAVLGEEVGAEDVPPINEPLAPAENGRGGIRKTWDSVTALGQPLVLGMALMATTVGLATYVLENRVLVLKIRWERRRRPRGRDAGRRDAGR